MSFTESFHHVLEIDKSLLWTAKNVKAENEKIKERSVAENKENQNQPTLQIASVSPYFVVSVCLRHCMFSPPSLYFLSINNPLLKDLFHIFLMFCYFYGNTRLTIAFVSFVRHCEVGFINFFYQRTTTFLKTLIPQSRGFWVRKQTVGNLSLSRLQGHWPVFTFNPR